MAVLDHSLHDTLTVDVHHYEHGTLLCAADSGKLLLRVTRVGGNCGDFSHMMTLP